MQKKIKSFDGIKINYSIKRVSNFFLIFLHGAGGDLNVWKNYVKFLNKKGFSTVAIDIRNHGFSEKPIKKTSYFKDCSKDIYQIIKKEKIKDFIIIGHCFGGMIALTFNKLYPNKSKAYILINSSYKVPILKNIFKKKIVKIILNSIEGKNLVKNNGNHGNYNISYSKGDFINHKRLYNDVKNTGLSSLFLIYANMSKFNEKSSLKKLNQKVLIIHGENDVFFKKDLVKKMNKMIKNSTLKIIPNANHWPIFNKTEKIQKLILKFLEKK